MLEMASAAATTEGLTDDAVQKLRQYNIWAIDVYKRQLQATPVDSFLFCLNAVCGAYGAPQQ